VFLLEFSLINFLIKELASEAEAKKVLYTIYEIRKNEMKPDIKEINRIEHGLSMIHFLGKDYKNVI
jgi:hypothetical protein